MERIGEERRGEEEEEERKGEESTDGRNGKERRTKNRENREK